VLGAPTMAFSPFIVVVGEARRGVRENFNAGDEVEIQWPTIL
jgi:hypothetical protein